jgi:hypothetical protein
VSTRQVTYVLAVATAAAVLAVGGCGEEESDEAQIRSVARDAAAAKAARDVGRFCEEISETVFAEREQISGKPAVCEEVLREQVEEPSDEELKDAETFEVVSVTVDGAKATAKVRTYNGNDEAYFVKEDREWKLIGSNALE